MLVLFVLLFVFTCALSVIQNKKASLIALKQTSEAYLCVKEYSGVYSQFRSHIIKTNQVLVLLNALKKGSLFIPALGMVTASQTQNLAKIIMLSQQTLFVSFLKYLGQLHTKGCTFTPQLFKSPVHYSGLKLTRDFDQTVKMRSEAWHVYLINRFVQIKIRHQSDKSTFSQLFTKKGNISLH